MRHFFVLLVLAAIMSACEQNKQNSQTYEPGFNILGLASPIPLEKDTTMVLLSDYFIDAQKIDSIWIDENIPFLQNGDSLYIYSNLNKPLGCAHFLCGESLQSIVLKQNQEVEYNFTFTPLNKYQTVAYRGEINGWTASKNPLSLDDKGNWVTTFNLLPGEYPYKLVVDGKEINDYTNADSLPNNTGGFNSIMKVGKLSNNQPVIAFEKEENKSFTVKANQGLTKAFVFWENYQLDVTLSGSSLTFKLPKAADTLARSHVRVFAFNPEGSSNDLLIPLENGKAIMNTSKLSRTDKQSFIMYFLLVDRFFNGNPSNDKPLNNPEVSPKADYFGGDLAGVDEKIKSGYFADLGVNTIWLSPIAQNPLDAWGYWPEPASKFSGYHGYWPISSTEVDFRFGTEQELKSLISNAHQGDMNVLIDYVANHVHEQHPLYKKHPDWATNLYLPDGTMNTEKWDEHRLTTWFDTFLPTLDFSKPEVVDALTDSAVFWFKNYQIDGFRHDATKHIQLDFWRTLTRKLKEQVIVPQNRPLYQIGETYGNPELINSYVNTGMLDAQFDFNLYDAAVAAFAKPEEGFEQLAKTLQKSLRTYGYHNLMGNISGNQDRARFISYADGSVRFDEDAKKAGWTRKIEIQDNDAYQKLAQLHAFNMSIPGIPVIYYGDEYGSPGGNDPDNRRQMLFDNLTAEQENLRNTVSNLCQLRSNTMALLYGNLEILQASDNILAFMRTYNGQQALVVFNKSSEGQRISLPLAKNFTATFNNKITQKDGNLEIQIQPFGFDILLAN